MNDSQCVLLLKWATVSVLLFAAAWFTAAFDGIDLPGRFLIDLSDWPLDGAHAELSRDVRWLSGIGAGLLAFLGLQIWLVVIPELESGNMRVRKGTLLALLGWYVIDNAGSVAAGVPSNVFFNSIYFVLLALPLWLIGKQS